MVILSVAACSNEGFGQEYLSEYKQAKLYEVKVDRSPLVVDGNDISYNKFEILSQGDSVVIKNFDLPAGLMDIVLTRVQIISDDAKIVVGSKDGQSEMAHPQVIMLSGMVTGDPTSMAYLAISPYGTNGFVELNGELISISTGPYAQEKKLAEALRSARMSELIKPEEMRVDVCGYTVGDTALEPSGPAIEYAPRADRGGAVCRIAEIAIETDWEFTDRIFGGNTNASAAYIVSLMGAVSEIYERNVNVKLSIPFLRVWADDSDPYSVAAGDPLDLVRGEWNATMGGVDRTLVHYFTGRTDTSYGGVAYLSVLCNESFGYGVSAYINGFFPYPLVDHNGGNWDVVVASHELGHNFGTGHTHDYSPQIDGCGTGDCSSAFGGTIMSYCHACSGGLANLVLQFHSRVQDTIIGYMDSVACLPELGSIYVVDDSYNNIITGVSKQLDVLANDNAIACGPVEIFYQAQTNAGGLVEWVQASNQLAYTSPEGYVGEDYFTYNLVADGQATSIATVHLLVNSEGCPPSYPFYIGGDIDGRIGMSVAISENYFVLGADVVNYQGDIDSGQAGVFRYDSDGMWYAEPIERPQGIDAYDSFGRRVGIDGETVVVSAFRDDDMGTDAGAVYVLERQNNGVWSSSQKIVPSDGNMLDWFGWELAFDNGTLVVTSKGDDDLGGNSGSVYIFRHNGTMWQQTQKIISVDGNAFDYFGVSVDLSGTTMVIGADRYDGHAENGGTAWVYEFDGLSWELSAEILQNSPEVGGAFGKSVAIDGDLIIVGSDGSHGGAEGPGTAAIYRRSGKQWILDANLEPNDLTDNAYFGNSVDIHRSGVAVVGAFNDSTFGLSAGMTHVYTYSDGVWSLQSKLFPSSIKPLDQTGWDVAISSLGVVVGQPWWNTSLGNSFGSVVFYDYECITGGLAICRADLNGDGSLNFFDVSAFLAAFSAGDSVADFTGDGLFNFFDVSSFLQVFSAGCP